MRVLVITAVEREKHAVLAGLLRSGQPCSEFDVFDIGVGPVTAAIGTMQALIRAKESNIRYNLVISTGIAGVFCDDEREVQPERPIVASAIVAGDIGAQTEDGFLSLKELGLGDQLYDSDSSWFERILSTLAHDHPLVGTVLSVSTITGTEERAQMLRRKYPDAVAEAMEGFGVAKAAHSFGVPVVELRTASNRVGRRDRARWKLDEALRGLENLFVKVGRFR